MSMFQATLTPRRAAAAATPVLLAALLAGCASDQAASGGGASSAAPPTQSNVAPTTAAPPPTGPLTCSPPAAPASFVRLCQTDIAGLIVGTVDLKSGAVDSNNPPQGPGPVTGGAEIWH